ncbi:DMP19 family protein [Symmachiella dynata]|uniref:DMP19 family protein n=1 Tax=Symmachiella dynata TaxID=2527995 RepID=UPI00118C47B6|nr:hypothetical protein [Symmachiella dynata]QDT49536.1 hypothetical protein Pan258_35880 [Symmachiella dynata]
MDTDWELEDWLLDVGERVEQKATAGGELTPVERLIREFWVFDMHTRNGGVSQYFCNYGAEQWQALKSAWLPNDVPGLGPILSEVDRVIAGAADPYEATLNATPDIEEFYDAHQLNVRRELRSLALDLP